MRPRPLNHAGYSADNKAGQNFVFNFTHEKGSLVELKGMNRVMAELPDNVEEIIELLHGDKNKTSSI